VDPRSSVAPPEHRDAEPASLRARGDAPA
jgi:hypothetical protein